MLNGGLISIRAILDQLHPSERKTAEFILDNPRDVVQCSIQRLAELSGVSEATVTRLCQKLNMKGFQELKMRIAVDLSSAQTSSGGYEEIRMGESVDNIVQAVSNNNKQSIDDTIAVLSIDEVNKAVDALSAARRINIMGHGASFLIAADLQHKLVRVGRWCEAYPDFHGQLTSAVTMQPGDVAFGISYSGKTIEIIEALTEAKKQGATVITLTKYGLSPVAELADIRLFTNSAEQNIRSGATASRIAQLNVIDIVYTAYASRQNEQVIPILEKTRIAISRTRKN
ncbi:RpiR family transcriptional regulator [Gordoniibacillus kamchatkensis]|uniref:RpiR family transcriptional regulator n=1 Tax=Gordoniibacillus kamchatkensis TaxID=1590651 RepID=A0ABR5AIC5_9BACL|nr:MurR/RpiR family transcriptional regulator [Paenibacillus sp. VKM B-2647]KIL40781.1 RpiR family transcriptional regulator [Paenibacillus sp. VKM B-2647]